MARRRRADSPECRAARYGSAPENRMLVTLYRGTDKKPPLLELSDIEAIAALPEFKSQQKKAGE